MSRTELNWLDDGLRARLHSHRQEMETRRFSTKPADRQAAEDGMLRAYGAAGLPPPERFVWCENPVALAHSLERAQADDTAGTSLKTSVLDAALRRAGKQIDVSVARAARAEIWRNLSEVTPRGSSRAVTEAVHHAASRPLPNPFSRLRLWLQRLRSGRRRRAFAPHFGDNAFSTHDRGPLEIYRFFHEACGLETATQHLSGVWDATDAAGWIAPCSRLCWLSERQSVLSFDMQGRLHADSGPALGFPDGWKLYAWKGVVVPAWMIEKDRPITVDMIERQRDPVLRRCMIDILTPHRFVVEADAVRVSTDDTGVLWMKSWSDWDRWAAVEVVNGTAEPDGTFKHYFLQVPPTVRSAREAVAWTYGMTEREYANLQLRT